MSAVSSCRGMIGRHHRSACRSVDLTKLLCVADPSACHVPNVSSNVFSNFRDNNPSARSESKSCSKFCGTNFCGQSSARSDTNLCAKVSCTNFATSRQFVLNPIVVPMFVIIRQLVLNPIVVPMFAIMFVAIRRRALHLTLIPTQRIVLVTLLSLVAT